ncbi:hypothetical protein PIB30_008321 [Stylosanthes scabra]|uniref:Secreted protein n=1 Tax=Stylosanthes scabra TaxID=79078 RepID=A0ABU6S4Q5_9FABA|nr:hypothetical protein [Stylosanthes scabra]
MGACCFPSLVVCRSQQTASTFGSVRLSCRFHRPRRIACFGACPSVPTLSFRPLPTRLVVRPPWPPPFSSLQKRWLFPESISQGALSGRSLFAPHSGSEDSSPLAGYSEVSCFPQFARR